MEDIIKIIQALVQTFSTLLSTLGASLLGNLLTGKEINRAGEGIVTAGYGLPLSSVSYINKMDF